MERAEARLADRARERLAAVTDLVSALADHRRAMWVREDVRLRGSSSAEYAAARGESHVTRSAITGPLTRVVVLAPELAPLAQAAADATYALRKAPDTAALDGGRDAAIAACDRLVAATAALL
ncbi:protein kilB [Streptomyces sp. NBC_01477]|uniref:protein kilB n=1 Tax=Streptomyces sp. NBC_01477 TaxID=2976015 RepID=UPI002E365BC2|nr:protein kilB [Streptomyces sp. NBC_01477]